MPEFEYVGSELDVFAAAHNWKRYWSSQIRPYVRGEVAELGAGIGANTPFLRSAAVKRWLCVEPDPQLLARLSQALPGVETACGTAQDLAGQWFDTLIYIDVLEHIEHDALELERAATLLRPGGRVIVLSPAHQWLFSPFDAAIGHYRRYNRAMLRAVAPKALREEHIFYLDAVGLLASAANKLFLKQSNPTPAQIRTWDSYLVPLSRNLADPILARSAGKTIIGVWKKPA